MAQKNPSGIPFSPENVRAIIEGRKTQTRRVVKNAPVKLPPLAIGAPYGAVGDRCYVKEALYRDHVGRPTYVSTDDNCDGPDSWPWKLKRLPSIFMPKRYARIWLQITEVRVERLQDISEDDAIAEGCDTSTIWGEVSDLPIVSTHISARMNFAALWNSLNSKSHPWRTNPWVWVYTFTKER